MSTNNGIRFMQITMGAVMVLHGLAKFLGGSASLTYIGGMPPFAPHNSPTIQLILGGLAAAFELLGGLAVLLGYKVRYACIALILVMLGATSYHLTQVHDFSSLMLNTWPIELALVFAGLAILGPAKKAE